ncbi:MAG: triose-phosphate isomerase [Candidatus Saccharibacteria bacterium]
MKNNSHKIIAANWKMNTSPKDGLKLIRKIIEELNNPKGVEVVICPPATHLPLFSEDVSKHEHSNISKLLLGCQNINQHEMGAYTGEISINMVKDYVDYVIVGHSERRKYYNETDEDIAQKIELVLRHKLKVILCVGENEAQRIGGHAKQTVLDQLNVDLSGVTKSDLDNLLIAYEPVWAIGTGNFAKPEEVKEMVDLIRANVGHIFRSRPGDSIKVLYGGSVNSDNAEAYFKIHGIDGLLLGGASLDYREFAKIVSIGSPRAEISI